MLLQKISILFLVLLLPLFKPGNTETSQNTITGTQVIYTFNCESLKKEIKNNGWNRDRLKRLHFCITNSESKKENLKELPSGFENSFINSLMLKKEQKYKEMFDTLFVAFSGKEDYLPFYEELVFAASATNQINLVEKKVTTENNFKYKEFLFGLISLSKSVYNRAQEFLNSALKRDSTKQDIFYHLSYAYRNGGDYENAGKILNKASGKFSDDNWFNTKLLLAKGSLHFLSADYDNALKIYNQALDLAIKNSDKQNEAKAYINLGIIEDISGNVEKSRDYLEKTIKICSSIRDYENLAIAYSELGVSYSFTNNLVEAKLNYRESKNLFEKVNNRNRLATLLNNIGKIYMNLFDYKSALEYYEKGLEYAGDSKRSQVINLTGIATVYANLSNYTRAIQYYRKAKEISSEIKEISLNAEIDSDLGSLNFNLDRFNNAIQYYSSARKFAEESGNPYLLTDLNHKVAISFFKLDSLNTAEKYFLEALRLSEENSIPYYQSLVSVDLGDLQKEKKEYKNALGNIHSGEKIAKQNGFDYLLARGKIVEGEIAAEHDEFKNAENLFRETLLISQKLNEFGLQVEANYKLAKLFDGKNFNEAAESYYKTAIGIIEDVSRPLFQEDEVQISYFSVQKEIYDSFAEFYLNQNKFKEAFELIDRSRSRNMVQNLSNLKLEVLLQDKEKLEKIYDYEWIIHSGIYGKEEVDSVNYVYDNLKKILIAGSPELEEYLNIRKTLTTKDIQDNLNDNENLISFYSTENKTYIFLITKKDFIHFDINAGREELLKLAEKISPYFNKDNPTSDGFYNQDLFSFNVKAAYNFYNKFLKQVLKEIPEGDKVIVSSSSELVSLPFDFLVASFNEENSPYNYKDKDYLIYHYSFSYTPSASVFVHQKNNNLKNIDKILIAGNPEINTSDNQFAERRGLLEESGGLPRNVALLPLKYSGEEITQISDMINADRVLTNNDATETGFKENAELARIIHLSTHSFLINKQPVIFFSNNDDEKNDGFLEAGEIIQLKLNSDLVVLSSCNSGLGNIDASEGIIGMTKAFFEAGSKSIVVSLWEVNDKFTSGLMAIFYEKLSEGYDKDEALRKAKIDFIKKYSPNPYFWGAFVLSGNTNKIDIVKGSNAFLYITGISFIIIFSVILLIRKKTKVKLVSS